MTRRRLIFILGLAVSWFLAIGARLYQVQVVRHDDYRTRAEGQQSQVVTLKAPRGTIYDRRGHELAVSVEVRSVAANPGRVQEPEATARALARVLGLNSNKQIRKLTQEFESKRGFVWVERRIDLKVAAKVEELGLEGVFLVPENKRYYPLRKLAAQVIGFVGTDNQGLSGLEYLWDPVVAPEPGRRKVVRDARLGTVLYPHFEGSEGRPGKDLHLTLDATIQQIVEHELEKAVLTHKAKRGMVVVMNPTNGAIYAMASYPTYDPNHFSDFPEEAWRNRPIMDVDEPGSTFKMVTLAAALEAGTVEPHHELNCEMGGIRFGKTLIKDHSRFGVLSMRDILAKSSNVGAIKIGQAAGRQRFYDTIKAFGFGSTTGIDLPSESPGLLRSLDAWSPLSPAYLSFGQGLSVTAIQLTNAFAAIANGGRLLKPYVVARVGRPGETGSLRESGSPDETKAEAAEFQPTERQVIGLPIAPSSVRQLRDMLAGVVSHGTAKAAAIPGYPAAGKTGTAQKAAAGGGYSGSLHVASFVGFAPVRHPEVVVSVIIDEPKPRYHGGEVAAPVFSAITEKTLLYLGVAPQREHQEVWPGQVRPPRTRDASVKLAAAEVEPSLPTPEGTVPDFAGLSARQALSESGRHHIRLNIAGHGSVVRQSPPPGTPLEEAGGRVRLWLALGKGSAGRGETSAGRGET